MCPLPPPGSATPALSALCMASRKQGGLFSSLLRRADSPGAQREGPPPPAPAPPPAMATQPAASPAAPQATPGSGAAAAPGGLQGEVSGGRVYTGLLTLYGRPLIMARFCALPGTPPQRPPAAAFVAARLPAQPPPPAAASPARRPACRAWTASPSPPPSCARCRWRSWCAGRRWRVLRGPPAPGSIRRARGCCRPAWRRRLLPRTPRRLPRPPAPRSRTP